jgi:hypothetical protein
MLQVLLENVMKHGGSALLLTVECCLSRVPITSTWMIFPVVYTTTYSVFLWIYWGIADEWVYKTLDWRKPGNFVYYVILSLLQVVVFWLMCAPSCS